MSRLCFLPLAEKLGCQAPLSFAQEPEEAFHTRVRNCFPEAETASPEGYLLTADNEGIRIFSRSEAGLFYGLQTLLDRVAEDGLCELELYETPVAPERGVKLYLPPPTPEGFAEFRKIIDLAAQCKYNFSCWNSAERWNTALIRKSTKAGSNMRPS